MYGPGPDGGSIGFATNDSPQQVYAFYDSQLGRAGWTSGSMGGSYFAPSAGAAPGNSPVQTSRIYMYGMSGPTGLPWVGFLPSIHATLIVDAFQLGSSNQVSVVLFKW
jgi:hypothetical protein